MNQSAVRCLQNLRVAALEAEEAEDYVRHCYEPLKAWILARKKIKEAIAAVKKAKEFDGENQPSDAVTDGVQ